MALQPFGTTWSRSVLLAAMLGALGAPLGAADNASWRVLRAEVRVVCPMTVGGSFEAKTAALAGTVTLASTAPLSLAGELSVDLRTLETGISLRDEHMQKNYLEVGRGPGYDHAVLSGIGLGNVDPGSFQGKTAFTGTFLLHGAKRPVSGQATIRREGQSVRVEASFPVMIPDYGIPKPQYLGVGVKNEVSVMVSFVAEPSAGAGSAR